MFTAFRSINYSIDWTVIATFMRLLTTIALIGHLSKNSE